MTDLATPPFSARYPGKCADCGDWYPTATSIKHTDGGYVHADCDDQPAREPIEGTACPVCWLRHPEGECDRD